MSKVEGSGLRSTGHRPRWLHALTVAGCLVLATLTVAPQATMAAARPAGFAGPPVSPSFRSVIPSTAMDGHAGLYGWGATTMGDGTVAIGDIWNRRVVHFDTAGNELGVLFTLARGINPYGIAADPVTNAIYVGSSQCCTVEVWGPDTHGVYQQLAPITSNKFHYPSRVAVAPDGTVYVDDMLANSIFGFTYNSTTGGHLVGTFGVHGSGPGQFKQPRGMGFDGSNPPRLFVMDSFNYRVQVWQQNTTTDALTYLSSFGSHGTAPGQFVDDNSRGIAIDKANGWLYAVDADANQVQKYDINTNPPGNFLLNIGGNGRTSNPVCCATPVGKFSDGGREDAVDGNGNLWVGDMPNFRAQVFDSNGVSQFAVPTPAQLPATGAFNFPQGVAVDASGNIVVTDSHNFRLEKFDPSANFLWQEGRRGRWDAYAFAYSQEVAINPVDSSIVVADTYNNFIKEFDKNGALVWQIGNSACATGLGQFCHPYGVAVGPDGTVYAADTHDNRIEVISPSGVALSTFTNAAMQDPRGLAVDQANGNIYVTSFIHKNVGVFNSSGTLLQTISNPAFVHPWDVVVDSSYVYVTDNGDNTVKVFNKSDGSLVSTFGGSGAGNGQLHGPEGLSLAPGGVVWVADTLNDRVESWCVTCAGPSSPTYVRTIGQNGQAKMYPSGLAVDSAGNVAVADTGNDTVQLFAAGSTTPTWTVGMRGAPIGPAGSGNDSFENPRDIAMDASFVYVADTENQLVQVLNKSDGSYVRNINFKFASPYGVSVGTDGSGHERILVSDGSNGKVYVFDTSDNLKLTIPPTTTNEGTRDAVTDSAGDVYTADYRNDRVDMYNAGSTTVALQWGGSGAPTCQQVTKPTGIDIDSSGHLYVASSTLDVVKEFNGNGTCVTTVSGGNTYGTKGSGAQQLFQLRHVAVGTGSSPLVYASDLWGLKVLTYNQDGSISTTQPELGDGVVPPAGGLNEVHGIAVTSTYVFATDTVNMRMQRFNTDGTSPITWSTGTPETAGGFNWAQGIGVDPVSGNVWVADTKNNAIEEFTPTGTALRTIGAATFTFFWPTAVSFDPSGNMYVADTNNNEIESFTVPTSGAPTLRWSVSTGGGSVGAFNHPYDVVYDGTQSSPRLLVTDTFHNRLVTLDPATGNGVAVLPMSNGNGNGQVSSPEGVTVAANGMIWVADTGNNRVEEFNPDGTFANEMTVGGYGCCFNAGNNQLNAPQGIQIGPDGLLYIADTSNNRIQVFQPV